LRDDKLHALAEEVLTRCRARHWKLALAESCTGGMVAAALTDIPSASNVIDRGFVTYANQAKVEMLGVPEGTIARHGAVSAETAAAMAEGALANAPVDLALAVTGIAGPTGGTRDKPVGLVWFAVARLGAGAVTERQVFSGDRAAIRAAATRRALELLAAAAS